MIRITYVQGNGYHCSCCRHESQEYEDFENTQDAVNWLSGLEARRRLDTNGDVDCRVVDIVQTYSINLSFDEAKVNEMIDKRKKDKEETERKIAEATKNTELAQLRSLQKKYPEAK